MNQQFIMWTNVDDISLSETLLQINSNNYRIISVVAIQYMKNKVSQAIIIYEN